MVGLTSALALLERGYCVSVVAKHMPGDYDAEYASPWAGANWLSVADAGSREAHWDELTFRWLWRLATQVPAAGVHVQDCHIYRRRKNRDTAVTQWQKTLLSDEPWFHGLVPGFRKLCADELPAIGADSGTAFTSVCINVALFLPYLVSQCLAHGGTFRRATVAHVCEAAGLHASGQRAAAVVNCSGLMACQLGGVMDGKVIPVRGQIVVVRNEIPAMITSSGADDGPDEVTYLMMRAAGASFSLSLCVCCGHLQLVRRRHRDRGQLPEGQLGHDAGPKHDAEDPEARHRGMPAAGEARAGRRRTRHRPGLRRPAAVADRRGAFGEGGD